MSRHLLRMEAHMEGLETTLKSETQGIQTELTLLHHIVLSNLNQTIMTLEGRPPAA